jgi:hypothetical protein
MKKEIIMTLSFCFALCLATAEFADNNEDRNKAINKILAKDKQLKSKELVFNINEEIYFSGVKLQKSYRQEHFVNGKIKLPPKASRSKVGDVAFQSNMSDKDKEQKNAIHCPRNTKEEYLSGLTYENGSQAVKDMETKFKLIDFEETEDKYKFGFDIECEDGWDDVIYQSKMETVFHKGKENFFPVEITITNGSAMRKIVYTKEN